MGEEEQEKKLRKSIRMNRFKIIMDATLIVVILLLGYYCYSEIENFKILKQDVCRLCEQKTGGTCLKVSYYNPGVARATRFGFNESEYQQLLNNIQNASATNPSISST